MARETLSRRRRPARDADYTEPSKDEPDDAADDEPAPRRGSRRATEKPATEKSSGRRRVHTDDDEDDDSATPGRSRRNRAAADEDEPRSGSKPKAARGWGAVAKAKAESSDFAEDFKVTKDETLFKFIDDEPFATYRMHWVERSGKKSFNCIGDGCPLCDDIGDNNPRLQVAFNVIEIPEEGDPVVKVWTVGKRVSDQIEGLAENNKTKPINRDDLYFSVSKSGKGTDTTYRLQAVKERDLEEDWDTQALSSEELDELFEQGSDEDSIVYPSKKQLREIASGYIDD